MSGGRRSAPPIVSRTYQHEPEDCARALALLLNQPVMKMADKPAPELADPDGAKIKEDSANENYTR